jgi:uroporphyrin-III C-methyltransferase / precorrin-2 dehydrogenase / sirohydrochlorin ferrochelatase
VSMEYLPIFVRLDGQPCLVVGGGAVAERKVRWLLRAGARITVVALALKEGLAGLRERGEILHTRREFDRSMLAGQRLVVAATDDGRVNEQVARAAERAGVLCNAVDNGAASGFIFPAIVDRAPVTIAIGTGGNAPVLAQQLKSRIERWLPARIGVLARRAGRWRGLVRKRFATLDERRRFWQRFFDGPIAQHILANRQTEAEKLMRRELFECGAPDAGSRGEAYIVGAGPGDPGLVTLRAQQLIGQADVVLHDRLVSASVLDFARKEAELVAVGKEAGDATMSQERINELLIRHVREGRRVCRLKGGDPFVFGRGGEEVEALAAAGLPYQIVPGISAAQGAAAYAGIPLTLRGSSGRVTMATARLDAGLAPDWQALARPGQTLALYMSIGRMEECVRELVRHGLAPSTPAAVVENATTNRQRVVHSTLREMPRDARNAGIAAPALLLIGETAALGRKLQWFEGNGAWDAFDGWQPLVAPQRRHPVAATPSSGSR